MITKILKNNYVSSKIINEITIFFLSICYTKRRDFTCREMYQEMRPFSCFWSHTWPNYGGTFLSYEDLYDLA